MRAEYAVESGREQQASSSGPRPLEDTPPPEPLSAVRARLISFLRAILVKPVLLLSIRSRFSCPNHAVTPSLQYSITESDWTLLLQQTERFAANELDNYCWREVSGGVLPAGYDANSIAAQAVVEFLRDPKTKALTRTPQELRKHLRKRARKIVNRLHHRMENEFMVSECDLYPIIKDYGEVIGALEEFPAPNPTLHRKPSVMKMLNAWRT